MKILITTLLLCLQVSLAQAQVSGENSYGVLQLPSGARSTALGGVVPALPGDITLVADNPALLDSVNSGDFAFAYAPFFGGVNYLNVTGAFEAGKAGRLAIGIAYVDYGDFIERDLIGTELGTFTPRDLMLRVSKSHRIGPFVLGASLKYANTSIAGYSSNAIMTDLGGFYQKPGSQLTFGMVLKNLGTSFSNFATIQPELPLDLHMGISFKPEHMPARFSLSAYNFVDSDLTYFGQTIDSQENPAVFQEVFRHINLGMELLIGKAFNFLIGYNHLRNQELRLAQGGFGAGFSWGFMARIKKLDIRFSRATYHAAGGMSTFSVQGNLSRIKKLF